MKRCSIAAIALLLALFPIASGAVTQENTNSSSSGGVYLEMNRPAGTVLNPGDEIGFRLVSEEDAYVIVFNIDTEGFVNLLYPAKGERPVRVRKGDTYLIPDDNSELLLVEGNTGVEFVFALVVPERDDIDRRELDYLGGADNLPREERYRVDGDPFIAANIIVGELVRGVSHREGIYLDYQYFFVNQRVTYPCYMCGECDGGPAGADCAGYLITANFDETHPLTYPLRRAYEMIEVASTPMLEDEGRTSADDRTFGQYSSDDGTVNINFYPYNSEVYYETRESLAGGTDVNVYLYDPYWYDPWYAGWYYYPRAYVGFYWGYPSFWWGFNWGYWGGYYCSAWYWPRCYGYYDCYRYNYCYYDGGYRYRPARYKDKYYGGDLAGSSGRTGYKEKYATGTSAYRDAYAQSAKRNARMKVASGDLRTPGRSTLSRVKSTTAYRSAKSRISYGKYGKTTSVQKYGRRSNSTTMRTYARKSGKYTPRSRSSYGVESSKVRSGRMGYTGLKARTQSPRSYRNPVYRSGKSRTTSRPVYRSGKSRTTSRPVYRGKSATKRSATKTYKAPTRSSRSKSTSKSIKNRRPSSSRSSKARYKSPSRSRSSSPARSSGSRSRSTGGRSKSGGKGRR
jgi:hypothetical protein